MPDEKVTPVGAKTGGYKVHAKGSKRHPCGGIVTPAAIMRAHVGEVVVFDFFRFERTGGREMLFVLKDVV